MSELLRFRLNCYKDDFNKVVSVSLRSKEVSEAMDNLISALWWAYAEKYPEFRAWTEKKVMSGNDDPNRWIF